MTSIRLAACAASFLAAFTGPAAAAPEAYTFDKNHTEVRFCWNHLGVSRQCAHFLNYDGELLYDEASPGKSTLTVTFQTGSIETLVPVFNEHMKGEKLFDAAKFPEITFKSTKFEKLTDKTGKVTGDLTIKGVTKPVTLDVTLNFAGAHPMTKKPSLGIGATASVKRTEFGVSMAAPFVSDEVSIEIQSELNKKI
jgi:polyisoprenoid-binding protein YceI